MKIKLSAFILIVLLLQSCYVQKAIYDNAIPSSFGGVHSVEIQNPSFIKKRSALTWAVGFSFIPAGAIAGTGLKVKDTKTNQTKEYPAVGALLGAILGGVVTQTIIMATNASNQTGVGYSNADKWVRKYNRKLRSDYTYKKLYGSGLLLIPRNEEAQFTARTEDEVEFFFSSFYMSKYTDAFISRSAETANASALIKILKYYPNNPEIIKVKRKYILNADSYRTLISRNDEYKDIVTSEELCQSASDIVKVGELDLYQAKFGTRTSNDNRLFDRLYQSKLLSASDLAKLIKYYPNSKSVLLAKEAMIDRCTSFVDLRYVNNIFGVELSKRIELKGIQMVKDNYLKLDDFMSAFPNSPNIHSYNIWGDGFYIGDWNEVEQQPQGKGIFKGEKGSWYIGTFNEGKLSGTKCKIIDINGFGLSNYEGEVSNNCANGYGVGMGSSLDNRYPLKDAVINYTGYWEDGRPNGKGKYTGKDSWIEGDFKSGYSNGYATMRSPDGIRISGNFSMGKPDGNMKIEKWSLFGILSSSTTINATTWNELNNAARKVISGYNSQIREIFSSSNTSSSSSSSGSNSASNDNSSSSSPTSVSSGNNITVLIKLMKNPGCSNTNYDSYSLRIRTRPADKEKYIVLSKKSESYWYNGCDFSSPLSWSKGLSFFKVLKSYYNEEIDRNASVKEVIYDDGNSETTL